MTFDEWWANYDDLTGIDVETAQAAWNAATVAEREKCAAVCDRIADLPERLTRVASECAAAIREGAKS